MIARTVRRQRPQSRPAPHLAATSLDVDAPSATASETVWLVTPSHRQTYTRTSRLRVSNDQPDCVLAESNLTRFVKANLTFRQEGVGSGLPKRKPVRPTPGNRFDRAQTPLPSVTRCICAAGPEIISSSSLI